MIIKFPFKMACGRREIAAAIERGLERALRRSHGRISWAPKLTAVRSADAAVLLTGEDAQTVRIQLLDHVGYPPWPTVLHRIEQRYADSGDATLRVPTAESFAAWKTMAWLDRRASRDLWDLWSLAEHGNIDTTAASLFVAHGPTGRTPPPWLFTSAPSLQEWHSQLATQTRLTVDPEEALRVVARAWADASTQLASEQGPRGTGPHS